MDLEAVAWLGNSVVARLWCEDKKDARFGDAQLERYVAYMPRGRGRLAAIVRARNLPGVSAYCEAASAVPLTWEKVAEIANLAGCTAANGHPQWRIEARRPTAPSRQRILSDFLGYLGKDMDIFTEPLTTTQAAALRDAGVATQTAALLLERSIERSSYGTTGTVWPGTGEPVSWQNCHLAANDGRPGPWDETNFEFARWGFEDLTGLRPSPTSRCCGGLPRVAVSELARVGAAPGLRWWRLVLTEVGSGRT